MNPQLPPAKNTHLSVDASILVTKYCELLTLVPDKTKWTEECLINNPPAYYRLLQIKGLCKAFKVRTLELFLSGDFLFERDMEIYRHYFSMQKSMEATRKKNEEYIEKGIEKYCHITLHLKIKTKKDIQYIIESYKQHFYYLDTFHLLKNDKEYIFSDNEERKRRSFIIRMATQNICVLVSPERTLFKIQDLIEHFGCPDVNVYEIDEFYK